MPVHDGHYEPADEESGIASSVDSKVAGVSGGDWVAAMRAADFVRAWEIADVDLAGVIGTGAGKHVGPRHLQRIWRGEALAGRRVLVRCYHGLGDTIQFMRFMAPLRRIAREVIVWCQPELVALVAGVDGVDRAVALHDGVPDVEFDADIEIMEVPHAIRAGMRAFAMARPYLATVHPSAFVLPRQGRLSVGLVWAGGAWDPKRAIAPSLLAELALPGLQLYSLQRGESAGAARAIGALDISTADLNELSHRLRQLDLVVTVDTMAAHLAGALGVETWVMLHSDCDWRWPRGEATYWYPSARLFHQDIAGNWPGVVHEVAKALHARFARQTCLAPSGADFRNK